VPEVFRATWWRTVVLLWLAVLLAGCGFAQVTEETLPMPPGAEGQVGDILVRHALFPYERPVPGDSVYQPGDTVAVQAFILNEGTGTDRLVSVSSPIAADGAVLGTNTIRGNHALTAGTTEPALAANTLRDTTPILLQLTDLNTPIRAGLTYPVVFTFARAGTLRLELPVATPDVPREDCPLPPNGKPPRVLTAPLGSAPAPPTPIPPDCSTLVYEPAIQVLDVEAPLTDPTWATEHDALLGFVEAGSERRLVRMDPKTGEIIRSRDVEGAGENFGLIAAPDERVALPLTESGRIILLDSETLEVIDSLGALPAPSRVAVQETSESLFALSEDGSTVTGLDYDRKEVSFRREVREGSEAEVESASDEAAPSFWLLASDAIAYFSGEEPPLREVRRPVEVSHKTFSPHDDSPRSAYLAAEGSTRVELLQQGPQGALEVVASTDVGESVEHLEAEPLDHRVYALTETTLVTMKFNTLEIVDVAEFRSALDQAGPGAARISDFTVGDNFLYLAVEGEPHIVKIRKESTPINE
jgi:copper(I)-binding protein